MQYKGSFVRVVEPREATKVFIVFLTVTYVSQCPLEGIHSVSISCKHYKVTKVVV